MPRNYFNSAAGDVFAAGEQGWDTTVGRMDSILKRRAGYRAAPKIAAGDYGGAAEDYGEGGFADEAFKLRGEQEGVDQAARQGEAAAAKARVDGLVKLAQTLKGVPAGQRSTTLREAAPIFEHLDIDPTPFMELGEEGLTDQALDMFSGEIKKKYDEVFRDAQTGEITGVTPGGGIETLRKGTPRPIELDPDKTYIMPDGGAEPAADRPIATARPKTDALFEALVAQESGGRAGVLGPQTDYGRAEGMTQMLPATAESMARKIGVPWEPALMRDKTERGAAYQRQLGQAYFQEGLEKYGGDPRKALMYYHGGPNERLWGPKTRAYADQVLARAGGDENLQGGPGGDSITKAPPGYRVLQEAKPKPKDAPSGYRWRGDALEFVPGGPADPKNIPARDASKVFTQEQQLRGQYGQQPEVKDLANVRSHITTIGKIAQKARDNPGSVTAQDDLALIFAFMKMLDPGSVVREGEFANAQNTAGIPDRVVNAYNNALKGTRLNDRQRAEFFNTASLTMDSYNAGAGTKANFYRDRATYYGLNPDSIAPKPTPPPARKAPPVRPAAKRPPLDDIFK